MKKLNKNFVHVVNALRDGRPHTGSSIGDSLHMTRSAVWKVIKKLQGYGIRIASQKGKGYVLQEPLLLLDKRKIKQLLENKNVEMILLESVDSTNAYLKLLKKNAAPMICLAEQQTQGQGRLQRNWYSPFGKNIYMSCGYSLQKDISELAGLSLVIGLAIVKTLNSYHAKEKFLVKWPNDIVYQQKKISGSLIEIQAESHGVSHVIIGIGININMLDDNNQITQNWTSLQKVFGAYLDRNELSVRLINNLLSYLEKFVAKGFTAFMEEWLQSDGLMDKEISLYHVNEKINGKVVGINNQGHLLLKLMNGQVKAFASGDTRMVRAAPI